MNLDEHYFDELETRWRAGTLLHSLVEGVPDPVAEVADRNTVRRSVSDESLEAGLPDVVAKMATIIKNAEIRLWLRRDRRTFSACYPSGLRLSSTAEIPARHVSRSNLRLQIVVQGRPVGCLELRGPSDTVGFRTVHRQLAESVVRLIGLRLACEEVQASRGVG